MDYRSTRGGARVCIEQAIMSGTAPDGGLYVPVGLPDFELARFAGAVEFVDIAERMLAPFFAGSTLEGELGAIFTEALNFPVPTRDIESGLSVLEMFHGPTAAFKDVGARFLAALMNFCAARCCHRRAPVPRTR